MRIVFMGSSEFACHSLLKCAESKHKICCVFTQPPRPQGRGMQVMKTPVHLSADPLDLPVYTPLTLKAKEVETCIRNCKADILVVVAYGLMIPSEILSATTYGGINVHFSLLPRWRGAAPVSRAILAGDKETGVSIMHINKVLDAGDILRQARIAINSQWTADGLGVELARMGAEELLIALNDIEKQGKIIGSPQNHSLATYAAKWRPADSCLDWHKSAAELQRQIRASPSGCYFVLSGERIKISEAQVGKSVASGNIGDFTSDWQVVCGDGHLLDLLNLQKPGKKWQKKKEFMRGNSPPSEAKHE